MLSLVNVIWRSSSSKNEHVEVIFLKETNFARLECLHRRAAGSGSEGRADAVGGQVQCCVRQFHEAIFTTMCGDVGGGTDGSGRASQDSERAKNMGGKYDSLATERKALRRKTRGFVRGPGGNCLRNFQPDGQPCMPQDNKCNADPFTLQVIAGANECLRIAVLSQEADLNATLVGPSGRVWQDDGWQRVPSPTHQGDRCESRIA